MVGQGDQCHIVLVQDRRILVELEIPHQLHHLREITVAFLHGKPQTMAPAAAVALRQLAGIQYLLRLAMAVLVQHHQSLVCQ